MFYDAWTSKNQHNYLCSLSIYYIHLMVYNYGIRGEEFYKKRTAVIGGLYLHQTPGYNQRFSFSLIIDSLHNKIIKLALVNCTTIQLFTTIFLYFYILRSEKHLGEIFKIFQEKKKIAVIVV